MIKLFQCVRKEPQLEATEFRRHWEEYGDKLREMALESGADKVVLNTTLAVGLNERLVAERGTLAPFDGVAEIWWERGAGIEASADEAVMQERISRLDAFRQSFMEVETSSFFFTIEKVVYERDA